MRSHKNLPPHRQHPHFARYCNFDNAERFFVHNQNTLSRFEEASYVVYHISASVIFFHHSLYSKYAEEKFLFCPRLRNLIYEQKRNTCRNRIQIKSAKKCRKSRAITVNVKITLIYTSESVLRTCIISRRNINLKNDTRFACTTFVRLLFVSKSTLFLPQPPRS